MGKNVCPAAPPIYQLYSVETSRDTHIHALFFSLSHLLTHSLTNTLPVLVCVCVWWGVMINSDLSPDMVGVVGAGSKGKGLQ